MVGFNEREHSTPRTQKSHVTPARAVIFVTIIVVLVLLSLEGGIRVWSYYFRSSHEVFNTSKGRYEPVPGVHVLGEGPPLVVSSKGFIGVEFEAAKPKDVYRIFTIGDSCTFGITEYTYPGILHKMLNAEQTGKKFEVINAGVEGYHSGFALARLKEDILQYQPDLVTIYVGWNDFMKANPENLAETGRYASLARLMEQSYLIKAYKKVIFSYVRPLIMTPNVASTTEDLHAYDAFESQEFRGNLVEMSRILRANHIKALIMTRPTVVREGMSTEELKRQNVMFPWYGNAYSVNKLLSLHRAYNRMIHSVADQEGIPLVDLDAEFEKYDKNRLFWDTMHPNEKGHQLIADLVLSRLRQMM
jgi:lysophospholipase L1-like esterase